MTRFILSLLLISTTTTIALAQSDKLETEFELMIFNRHIWRGAQLGDSPAIEPSLTLSKNGFSFNLWAAHTINNSYSEIDLIPSYTFNNTTFTVFDYYNPVPGEKNSFFNFSEGENRHSIELAINYEANPKLPVNLMWGTFIFGDKNPLTNRPYYSSYGELGVPFSLAGINFEPSIGMSPFKGYYAQNAAIVHTALFARKEIKLSERWILPIQASGIYNPYSNRFFMNIACGFRFN